MSPYSPGPGLNYLPFSFLSDSFKLNEERAIDQFTLGTPVNDLGGAGHQPMNAIGFGSNSTLLTELISSGRIKSRTLSIFWGETGETKEQEMDRALILGEFDNAKAMGEGYTQELIRNKICGSKMLVTITDLTLHFPNGNNASLFGDDQTEAIKTCLDPAQPGLMGTPRKHFEAFTALTTTQDSDFTRSLGLDFYSLTYKNPSNRKFLCCH